MLRKLFDGKLPKAVLFDLDGTLIDSVPELAKALDTALESDGLPPAGPENTRLWVGNGARKLVQRALASVSGVDENAVPEARFDMIYRRFLQAYGQSRSQPENLYPGVTETLGKLYQQGVAMAVVTNKPQQFVPGILHDCGIAGFFQQITGGDTLENKKPHPEPLLHTAQNLQVPITECVMVGDSASDIEAARAAGMISVCVTYGYNHGHDPRQLPADKYIDCFEQLLDME